MFSFPINYNEPLFRPPSEGRSLIIQVTLGCSWNKCAFCEMYTSKHFKPRKQEDIFKDIDAFIPWKDQVNKVFLADGDPLVLSNKRLIPILKKLKDTFPNLIRISTYASPSNVNNKSSDELKELHLNGLELLYIGIESGDNEVLEAIQKGETKDSTITGINKAQAAGMDASVMIITGVGGKKMSLNHAIHSAEVLNATQPKYASSLVLTTHKGLEHYKSRFKGEFVQLNQEEELNELLAFTERLELENTIYRSNHVSNKLVLKGVLGEDKDLFLSQIRSAMIDPENLLRPYNGGY